MIYFPYRNIYHDYLPRGTPRFSDLLSRERRERLRSGVGHGGARRAASRSESQVARARRREPNDHVHDEIPNARTLWEPGFAQRHWRHTVHMMVSSRMYAAADAKRTRTLANDPTPFLQHTPRAERPSALSALPGHVRGPRAPHKPGMRSRRTRKRATSRDSHES